MAIVIKSNTLVGSGAVLAADTGGAVQANYIWTIPIVISGIVTGDVLVFNGTDFVPVDPSLAGGFLSDVNTSTAVDGDVLIYNQSLNMWLPGVGGGGGGSIATLSDVTLTSLTGGQVLQYDSGAGKWVNVTLSLITALASLSDVTLTTPGAGQFLEYDGSKWINHSLVAGDIPNIAESQVTSLVSDLALLAPKASPALTGTPTAPTATALSDNTTVANTKYVDDAISVVSAGITSSGAAPPRTSVVKTTASLASGASETGTVTMAKSFQLQRVTMDRASRFRLYRTAATRDADLTRPFSTQVVLGSEHGCIADLYLSTTLDWYLDPVAMGYNGDSPQSTTLYYTITNNTGSTHTVQATIYLVAQES